MGGGKRRRRRRGEEAMVGAWPFMEIYIARENREREGGKGGRKL